MAVSLDDEHLIMAGVLVAALILWGGIVSEYLEVYPSGTVAAATALGVFIAASAVIMLAIDLLTDRSGRNPD